jgi:hypothetical protein
MKKRYFVAVLLIYGLSAFAQNQNIIQYPQMAKQGVRKEIHLPDILGFKTLKCDFHMHTIFSDGIVWPPYRVDEAWKEGLDAIAITDHIEHNPSKLNVSGDHNAGFLIAREEAVSKNILLVHAGEITRSMPPGHLNALFISDANLLDVPDPKEALLAAKKQGAFIIWNHPGWKDQQPDSCRWWPMHEELYEAGLINGVEVFNELEYYPIAVDWCLNRKMAVIANSDIHDITSELFDLEKGHRPMTLVFAHDRSLESLKEAMENQRTLAYFDNKMAGKEEYLKAVFNAAITVKPIGKTRPDKESTYMISNSTDIPFELENAKGERFRIPANATVEYTLVQNNCKGMTVRNLFKDATSNLVINLF